MNQKLYQVIKALSAMKLTKTDSVPSPIIQRATVEEILEAEDQGFSRSYHLFKPKDSEQDERGGEAQVEAEADKSNRQICAGEPCLYQGSIGTAFNKQALNACGITHILTAADNINPRFPDEFKYLVLPLLDTPIQNIKKHFEEAVAFIEGALSSNVKHKVLVHCFAGKSRASTITLAFLMQSMNVPLDVGLRHLKAQRPIACPNMGFVA
jgi:hypothetical protein